MGATYYSRAIPAPYRRPSPPPRRTRGTVDRPLNARLYRVGWLFGVIPLLALAFTIARPAPWPDASATLESTFDAASAHRLAVELAGVYPDRSPGSDSSRGAARWVADELRALGLETTTTTFAEKIPGRGSADLRNVTAVVPGHMRDTILVVAHRDSTRGEPGINDNASGTGALIELARAYAATRTGAAGGVSPNHTIVFASTDAGAYGLLGARRLARSSPYAGRIVAVVDLDSIGSRRPPRLEIAGHGPRSPAPGIVVTASARIDAESGHAAKTAPVVAQLIDLALPFSLYEQDAFLSEGIPAVTLTTEGGRPGEGGAADGIDEAQLGKVGRAAERLLGSLDTRGLELAQGTSTYVYAGGRVIRGWAIAFLYVVVLVPFLLALVDLLVRLRRRGLGVSPAVRSYVRRLAFWLWIGVVFFLLGLVGAWPSGAAVAVNPAAEAAGHWPRLGLAALVLVGLASWVIARGRLVRRGPVSDEDEIAGLAVALAAVALISFVLIATNIYALIFLLPSAHAWLWLIELRRRRALVKGVVYAVGLLGPTVLLLSFAVRYGLGLDAPWYLAELVAIGYVPHMGVVLFLCWLAAAGQVLAVISERYGPYPARAERPARGPIGRVVAAARSHRRDEVMPS